jgi:hypothetical protein
LYSRPTMCRFMTSLDFEIDKHLYATVEEETSPKE